MVWLRLFWTRRHLRGEGRFWEPVGSGLALVGGALVGRLTLLYLPSSDWHTVSVAAKCRTITVPMSPPTHCWHLPAMKNFGRIPISTAHWPITNLRFLHRRPAHKHPPSSHYTASGIRLAHLDDVLALLSARRIHSLSSIGPTSTLHACAFVRP